MGNEGSRLNSLEQGLRAGFIDAATDCGDDARPWLVYNSKETGSNLLSVIKRQLSTCDSFDFCVAFVADGGLQPLVEVFSELAERGVRGRFLTSTYLNFNSPAVFRKLLSYSNIEVRVYQGSMHAKGYLFNRNDISTIIVGSSNLTQTALTCNKEWNVLFRSYERGGLLREVKEEFDRLWGDASTQVLDGGWIDRYEEYRASRPRQTNALGTFVDDEITVEYLAGSHEPIKPNKMQERALEALSVLHGRGEQRALLVSATGTGKTYLSAFDVLATDPERVLFLAHRQRILTASVRSFKKLLGEKYTYGLYEPGSNSSKATCLFAMCSTICRHLEEFSPNDFDYIVIDEAHRVGASSYQSIMSYFKPGFYLGMTATPGRTDNYDVFAQFNHVIAYQITLQDALSNDMLAPFHYFGIADLSIDDEAQDDLGDFSKLASEERVRHVISKIEEYTVDDEHRKGLIFCGRNDEATELSAKFNERGYRTCALSGADSDEARNAAIKRLESGELQYIFSVDIFNEGVDIPSVNQVIMLRRTESAIVFVQQLGRGLRKDDSKEYTLVLDFIGNYQKNFLVPVALSGDKTYNKDRLRRIVQEGSSVIPGASTVSFDRISESRIYRAIDGGDFSATKFLRDEYMGLRQMLGRIPSLEEFDRNGSIDPLLIFAKFGSYHAFLAKYEKSYDVSFSDTKEKILKFVSQKLASGKRAEELELLRSYVAAARMGEQASGCSDGDSLRRDAALRSARSVLCGSFSSSNGFVPLMDPDGNGPSAELAAALRDPEFRRQLTEVVDFGLARHASQYANVYKDTNLVLNAKYTYEEVCRLLNWSTNVNGQNIGGYKYDRDTKTFPVFINYDKAPDISDSIRYEDRFVSDRELIAISKQPRSMSSNEIVRLKEWPGNGMKVYLFMRKNKEDKGGKEFYFLGEMRPTGQFEQFLMPVVNKSAVEITYELENPVRPDLYAFLTSNLSEDADE